MAERRRSIKVEYDEAEAPNQRFKSLLKKLVDVSPEDAGKIIAKERRAKKRKSPSK